MHFLRQQPLNPIAGLLSEIVTDKPALPDKYKHSLLQSGPHYTVLQPEFRFSRKPDHSVSGKQQIHNYPA